jgi:hypothetical protein
MDVQACVAACAPRNLAAMGGEAARERSQMSSASLLGGRVVPLG